MKKLLIGLILIIALVGCAGEPDATSSASITASATELVESLGSAGNWLTAITADVSVDGDLTVDGTFHQSDDSANAVYRKLALHTQDDSYNVIDNFTLTVNTLVVKSENFTVFYGTIKGDVLVEADGFALVGTTVDGDVIFANEAVRDSADLDKDGKGAEILGEIRLAD